MSVQARIETEFEKQLLLARRQTNRIFVPVFVFQFVLAITFALWISPRTWNGLQSEIHPHVLAAFFVGGLLAAFPILNILRNPNDSMNPYYATLAQMLFSTLLIHVSGGRVETHFHIFGSLALLAFYRSWKIVALATIITAADHFLRGAFAPESIYGVANSSPLRAFEHAGWVLFEASILCIAIHSVRQQMKALATSQAELHATLSMVEAKVEEQRLRLIETAKLSALGEMSGSIAHEINNPIGIIQGKAQHLIKRVNRGTWTKEDGVVQLEKIVGLTERLGKIVTGLRSIARNDNDDAMEVHCLKTLVDNAYALCEERLRLNNVKFEVEKIPDVKLVCRNVQIEQVLINLVNNSYDAIENRPVKWIRVGFAAHQNKLSLTVTDCGTGIAPEVVEKLMSPFFTTKAAGKGTGLGLSISKKIVDDHKGRFYYNRDSANTQFVVELPIASRASVAS